MKRIVPLLLAATLLCLASLATAAEPMATSAASLKVAKDFEVELLYSVPKDQQGSWVSMCVDPQGRLIVCDQYGGLFRVTPQEIGSNDQIKIDKIDVDLGEAQGLLWAFDSLYVMVNTGGKYANGLYRVRDTDNDDQLDTVEHLRELEKKGGEHGPHALLLSPDGKSLHVVCGNQTKLPEIVSSRVPQVWDEDLLLPRTYGSGFMKGVPAPGGFIAKVDADGQNWEVIATGFRNEYDAAFNKEGELFAYDADMEWDLNTPWYRPTRVCHVVSGAEFGWRNGSGKWPAFYPDSVPAVVNVGPGSPTGVTFGYGAKFPAKYQNALFICDWSYGKLYATHLSPDGASYSGELEEFVTGTPLPLTDIVINPHDGAMYFAVGGRRVQSGLYRVTYAGNESTEPAPPPADPRAASLREQRRKLEALHGSSDPEGIAEAWPYLGHEDRFIRYAARVAIEHIDVSRWQDKALGEQDPATRLTALLALARVGNKLIQPKLLTALDELTWQDLSLRQQTDLVRTYAVALVRMGKPDNETRGRLIKRFDAHFPAGDRDLDGELAEMLVYLQAPSAARKTVPLMVNAPTQEEQINYAKSLRFLQVGWTMPLREQYFAWFNRASSYRGGASFALFVQHIKEDAVKLLPEEALAKLRPVIDAKPKNTSPVGPAPQRPVVKDWKLEELIPLVEKNLKGRDFERGRDMFAAANCFACHRFDNRGGAVGPDLTSLAGRFNQRDLLESIVTPDKVISDQYQSVNVLTTEGKVISGRIVNLSGDVYKLQTDMLDPGALTDVHVSKIEEMAPSKVSMMPAGLLNTLHKDEIYDLMAYLLSRGDPEHAMFNKSK